MNCEHCESQLLSLVEHELPPGEAEQVQEHLSACASCKQSFDRLAMGHQLAGFLPQEEAPSGAHARILEAARARTRGTAPDAAKPAAEAGGGGGWASFIEWLKGLTLGPQVAMAMVMLLVVAIGLIYLPDLHGRPGAQGEPVVHPESAGEAAPTVAAEGQPGAGAPAPTPAQEQQPQTEAKAEKAAPKIAPKAERGAARIAKARRAHRAHSHARRLAAPMPRKEAQASSAGAGASAGSKAAAAAQVAEDQIAELQGSPATSRSRAANAAAAPPAPAAPMAKAGAPAEAEQAAPARSATPTGSIGAGQAATLLRNARAERAAGSYRSAASTYELYLARTASSHDPARGQAMLEAADCYRHIGRTDRARHWLTLAAKNPATAATANRELRALQPAPAADSQ